MNPAHLSCFAEGIEMVIDQYITFPNTELRNKKLRELKEICETYPDLPIDMTHKTNLYNVMSY